MNKNLISIYMAFAAILFSCGKKSTTEVVPEENAGSTQSSLNYPGRYMGWEDAPMGTHPSGAVHLAAGLKTNTEIIYDKPTITEVAKDVWVIGGYAFWNCMVVITDKGLIVFDSGDSKDEGAMMRELIKKNISQKPIIAQVYSHSHYAFGTGALVDDPKTAMVIGHEKTNEAVMAMARSGGAPAIMPEIGPVLTARTLVQFANFLPDTGQDANIGKRLKVKETAFLPVTKTVKNGEILNIGGTTLQFFTEHRSDDYSLTVYLPETKVVYNNMFMLGMPNLYSLRGMTYREPQDWRDGVLLMRDLKPEVLVNTHSRHIVGAEAVFTTLSNYADLLALMYDQTLRGILHGLGKDDLRYFIYRPKHLTEPAYTHEPYGEIHWMPEGIYNHQMGWFDRDVSTLNKLPPAEEAKRLVELMGGRSKVLEAAKTAQSKKEYAWAAQLGNYLYVLDKQDKDVRQLLAGVYRTMGQMAWGSIGRNFFISEARALEGSEVIPTLIPPPVRVIENDPKFYVNMYRVRIDPRKSENTEKMVVFNFSNGTSGGLHVRRGIAEFVTDPAKHYRPADIDVTVDAKTWAALYLNAVTLDEAAKSGGLKMNTGSLEDLKTVMDFFDKFDPVKNYTIPPTSSDF
jgi:alkyl sulfatase BDS1-like metallo-beta-lactamase superfamily hydrolase